MFLTNEMGLSSLGTLSRTVSLQVAMETLAGVRSGIWVIFGGHLGRFGWLRGFWGVEGGVIGWWFSVAWRLSSKV